MHIIKVIPFAKLPIDKPRVYTYFTSFDLSRGSLVLVPLYKRQVKAVVVDSQSIKQLSKMEIRKASFELKQIINVLCRKPILSKNQFSLVEWMTDYYYASPGLIVKTVLPEKLIKNEKQLNLLAFINKPEKDNREKLAIANKLSGNSSLVIGSFEDRLKTYFKEIKNILRGGNAQVLLLVPQVFSIDRIGKEVSNKFPDSTVSYVSSNTKISEFRENWQKIRTGSVKIIIGTRSSVFMPFNNLRLIIIDEEENSGHISWDMTPKYDVRKVAEKLAEFYNAKLILGSSIPSVEYYYKLLLHKNNNKFKFQVPSSKFQVVDMRDEIRKGNYSIFSDDLLDELKITVNKGGTAILFVNRRGSFRFVMCRDCGFNAKCKNCDVPMVCHETNGGKFALLPDRRAEVLKCHHCSFQSPVPSRCPQCQGSRIKGFGIGTQRVEQEIKKLFPRVKVLRIDSDANSSFLSKGKFVSGKKIQGSSSKADLSEAEKFKIIVGTQMIFSLPWLKKTDLVGIVAIDSMINLPDWRSGERTFHIITKLSDYGEKTIIQTYNPDNFIIQSAVRQDHQSFYDREIEERKDLSYPPFSQIVKLVYRDSISYRAKNQAHDLELRIKNSPFLDKSFFILGPSPAFIAKERGKWIYQIILKIKDEKIKDNLLRLVPAGWEIEVDPESLL